MAEADLFDEAAYLRLYPGLQQALDDGTIASLWQHYDEHGRREGRRMSDLDPEFYCGIYPQVEEEFGPLNPAECVVHYAAYGRARGYLPRANAPRAVARVPLPLLSGLWTDAPDALDTINGAEETRRFTDRQAAMLRRWRQDGFVVLDRPAEHARSAAAALDIERIFADGCPGMLFECPARSKQPLPWQAETVPHPAAALDVHYVSEPLRALILGDPMRELLSLLFGTGTLLAASRGYLRQPVGVPRRSSALFGCSLPRRFVSARIALEDANEVMIWRGSHRLPAVPITGGYASLPEASRLGLSAPDAELDTLDAKIASMLRQYGSMPETLRLNRGEVAVLHADLIHRGVDLAPLQTGRGVTAQLCPRTLMPTFAEGRRHRLYARGGDRFITEFYIDSEPLA
jgi:hypothetical protein